MYYVCVQIHTYIHGETTLVIAQYNMRREGDTHSTTVGCSVHGQNQQDDKGNQLSELQEGSGVTHQRDIPIGNPSAPGHSQPPC